jgi:acyl-homoserine-lactone acylase
MTLSPQQIFSKPWQADNPLQTPSGLANINIALAVLEGVAAQTQLLYGKLDVTWGEVVTMQQGKYHQPAIGAPGELGSLRVLNFKTNSEQKYEVNFGDSYITAIAFSDPIQAQTLLVYGNASQPQSPHLGDQLSLYGKNQLRPVWRQREEILAHLELQEVLK